MGRSFNRAWGAIIALIVASSQAVAAGGTSIVATRGTDAYVSPGWPEGAAALVNDEQRTTGWNDWFSEWPNDCNHYAYAVQSTADINRLIEKLAAIKGDLLQVRLSFLKEPQGLGWVTSLDEGNDIPVIFSIGDQQQMDEWYGHVRKPFGVIEFKDCPVAVKPTLTIFVQQEVVNLDELRIPAGVEVLEGYVPRIWHQANTVNEDRDREEAANAAPPADATPVPPEMQAAIDRIHAYLKSREPQPE
jgi:hypothetical protein